MLCHKPYFISYNLIFLIFFIANIHLYPSRLTSLGVRTTCPKIFYFSSESNSAFRASFYFGHSFMCTHSSGALTHNFSHLAHQLLQNMQKIYQRVFHFDFIFYHYVHNILTSHNHWVPEFLLELHQSLQGFYFQSLLGFYR
jgi:hypothetical protein